MNILSGNIFKFAVLVAITLTMFVFWQNGFEAVYARFLTAGTNMLLNIASRHSYIAVDLVNNTYHFGVTVPLEDGTGYFSQTFGSMLQPTVIIFAWQMFLFVVLKWRSAAQSFVVNFSVLYILQLIFLTLLTGYYDSSVMRFIYEMLMDTFYIFTLVLIIKDNFLYSIFRKAPQE